MPYVKVVDYVWQRLPHVGSNRQMPVRDKCCDKQAIPHQELHAGFESLKFHCWTAASLISLFNKKKRYIYNAYSICSRWGMLLTIIITLTIIIIITLTITITMVIIARGRDLSNCCLSGKELWNSFIFYDKQTCSGLLFSIIWRVFNKLNIQYR